MTRRKASKITESPESLLDSLRNLLVLALNYGRVLSSLSLYTSRIQDTPARPCVCVCVRARDRQNVCKFRFRISPRVPLSLSSSHSPVRTASHFTFFTKAHSSRARAATMLIDAVRLPDDAVIIPAPPPRASPSASSVRLYIYVPYVYRYRYTERTLYSELEKSMENEEMYPIHREPLYKCRYILQSSVSAGYVSFFATAIEEFVQMFSFPQRGREKNNRRFDVPPSLKSCVPVKWSKTDFTLFWMISFYWK